MTTQPSPLSDMLGRARYEPYIKAAQGDRTIAQELYSWSVELAGAWHSHICYIEVAVRNSMDRTLRAWNSRQMGPRGSLSDDWTAEHNAGKPLYQILRQSLPEARENAAKEAQRRPTNHARHGAIVTHDDVIAQLSFGAWSRLISLPKQPDPAQQQRLWAICLRQAFPYARQDDAGRRRIGQQMEQLRALRNRVAHHDNLLQVNTLGRLESSLALLASIEPAYADLVMPRNPLRRLCKEDPRHHR